MSRTPIAREIGKQNAEGNCTSRARSTEGDSIGFFGGQFRTCMKHSEHLLHTQNELVASRSAFGAYLAIAIDVEKPFTGIQNHAWTDRTDLLSGTGQIYAIAPSIRELLQVISVRSNVEILDHLEGECAVEMDCLTGLGGSSILNERRRIVYPVP